MAVELNIEIITKSDIESIKGYAGNFMKNRTGHYWI